MIRSHNRMRIRIIPVSIAAAILITVILVLIFFPYSGTVQFDIVYDGERMNGILIRNEVVADLSGYEKLVFDQIEDGQAIREGDRIVTAYKKGYLKTSLDKLRETEKNIVAYQNQSVITGYDDRTIVMYDFDISVLIRRMSEETEGYISLYHQLCQKMREREAYIRATYNTDSNTYLQGLYQDERSITESLLAWRDELAATSDGYVSFYCDVAENETSDLSALSTQGLRDQLKRENELMPSAFKLVTDETWYIAVPVDNPDRFASDMYYPLYIGASDTYETAYLQSIVTENRGAVLIFRLEDNVEEYLDLYRADLFIGQRYEGFSVPNRYIADGHIKMKDENGADKLVAIRVLYADHDKTIFETDDVCRVGEKVYR